MLKYVEDLNKLSEILVAELSGKRIDHDEARSLAESLSANCPVIADTLGRIRERMTTPAYAGAA